MADETKDPLREDWLREKIERLADKFDLNATEFDSIGEPEFARSVTYNETVAKILRAALSAPAPEPQGWEEIDALIVQWREGLCGGASQDWASCLRQLADARARALRASVSGAPGKSVLASRCACGSVLGGDPSCPACLAARAAADDEAARWKDALLRAVRISESGDYPVIRVWNNEDRVVIVDALHAASAPGVSAGGAAHDYVAEFERLAEAFRRETGLIAPGKDVPAAMNISDEDEEERRRRWPEWLREREAAVLAGGVSAGGEAPQVPVNRILMNMDDPFGPARPCPNCHSSRCWGCGPPGAPRSEEGKP